MLEIRQQTSVYIYDEGTWPALADDCAKQARPACMASGHRWKAEYFLSIKLMMD